MARSPYQVLILGGGDHQRLFRESLLSRMDDLGLGQPDIDLLTKNDFDRRNRNSPTVAIFFGTPDHAVDASLIPALIEDSIVIIPVVSAFDRVQTELPQQLQHINALVAGVHGEGLERSVSLVLESFRLLRRERRLFISYRRVDAQPFSERLYDALDARGFDVFIDLRSVPPAADFQAELWHRMSDSDVVVLIDTPGFRNSRWTREELARANATNIQILHLLWPGQKEDSASAFSHFLKLGWLDFWGLPWKGRFVRQRTVSRICTEIENLRARAMAARYRYLIDNFCDAARDLKLTAIVQPEQWVEVSGFQSGETLAAVPAIGIPTANRINDIFNAILNRNAGVKEIWVVFDNRGVLASWLTHLDWLDQHLPLRTVQMSKAPERLLRMVV